jgi:hypothetical protein
MRHINNLKTDRVNLVEIHIAHATPEMEVLVDMNSNLMNSSDGKPKASQHRQTELNMLLAPEFRNMIGQKFKLITYADLLNTIGVAGMKRPQRPE